MGLVASEYAILHTAVVRHRAAGLAAPSLTASEQAALRISCRARFGDATSLPDPGGHYPGG